ncbi:hypothetical protein [Sorangium sp. So ce1024]|uniref:hypothetical protein n=1 Tax=Sorangium sp. So ce1024 TaxID=3133327 RepID=UPI003F0AD96C
MPLGESAAYEGLRIAGGVVGAMVDVKEVRMVIVTTSAGKLALTVPPTLDGREIKIEEIARLDKPEGDYTYMLVYSGDGAAGSALISNEDASFLAELIHGPRIMREKEIWCVLFRDQLRSAPAARAAVAADEAVEELRRRDMIETMYGVLVVDGRNR